MKTVLAVVITVVVLAGGFLIYIYSGFYNIAANAPHSGPTLWLLDVALSRSVARHARGIQVPDLTDPDRVGFGSRHFHEMCVQCHGGPGVERSEAGEALYPKGPDLTHAARRWSPRELYWITRNGIKMSGMPAWGRTTEDDELWALVAFIQKLPAITPEQYRQMIKTEGPEEEHHHEKK